MGRSIPGTARRDHRFKRRAPLARRRRSTPLTGAPAGPGGILPARGRRDGRSRRRRHERLVRGGARGSRRGRWRPTRWWRASGPGGSRPTPTSSGRAWPAWEPIRSRAEFARAFAAPGAPPPPRPAGAAGRGPGARDRLRALRRGDAVRRGRRSTRRRPASPRPAPSSTWTPASRCRPSSATARAGGGGLMDKLFAAGQRVLTGESLFMTLFANTGGAGPAQGGLRRPLPRQDRADAPRQAGRDDDLPEGRLPLRRQGHLGRHRLPAQAGGRLLRRRGLHPAEARRRRLRLRPRLRRHPGAGARRRRDAAGRHRLPGRLRAAGHLRHPGGARG